MNILGCLDTPTSGTYVLKGQDVSSMTDDQLAEVPEQGDRLRVPNVQSVAKDNGCAECGIAYDIRRQRSVGAGERAEKTLIQ